MNISRERALELIEGNKGKFITVTFTKKGGDTRVLNGQYVSTTRLGYVKMKDTVKSRRSGKDCIRNVNLQTITALKCQKQSHKVG